MNGGETFEFAAAVAGVSIGLAALLVFAVLGALGLWRLSRHAGESSLASARAALSVEELARRVSMQAAQAASIPAADAGQFGELRRQTETLIDQQRQLQEMARSLFETAAEESPALAFDELESAINRLDVTVGQMAASLANLIQLLERQQERR